MARYCRNCGREIQDNYNFCTNCGTNIYDTNINSQQYNINNSTQSNQTNVFAILGLIFSIVFGAILGLTFSLIGLNKSKSMNDNGRGLAIAGIIISSLRLLYVVYLIIRIIIGITTNTYY